MKSSDVSSQQQARKAAGEFANYVHERTGHQLPQSFVLALGEAEWHARTNGSGSVPVAEFAHRATQLFLETLGGPGAKAPATGTASPYYVITPEKLNGARSFYRRHAPGAIPSDLPEQVDTLSPSESTLASVKKAYPIELFLALYLCVSEDLGRQVSTSPSPRLGLTADPGAPPPRARRPFGDAGSSVRRPVSRLFSERILTELLALAQ
jgi:hypothetical protein